MDDDSPQLMDLQYGFQRPAAYRGGWFCLGNFDGVHRGHQRLMTRLVAAARRTGVPAVAFTFEPSPGEVLFPERRLPRLTTTERKAELLAACGVDCVIVYPTDRALLALTAAEFFDQVVRGELQARGLVEGPDFCFGTGRQGTIAVLRSLCDAAGVQLEVPEVAQSSEGQPVSSSAIRAAVLRGEVALARQLLGRPHRLTGHVAAGARRGRTLGFPTANLDAVDQAAPCSGVYSGRVEIAGTTFPAAVNIGPAPTFDEAAGRVEVHLVGFSGDLYGQTLAVDLLDRLRDIHRFASVAALQQQLTEDVAQCVRQAAAAAD